MLLKIGVAPRTCPGLLGRWRPAYRHSALALRPFPVQAARVSCSLLCSFDGLAPKRAVLLLDAGGERLGGCHASLVTTGEKNGDGTWHLAMAVAARPYRQQPAEGTQSSRRPSPLTRSCGLSAKTEQPKRWALAGLHRPAMNSKLKTEALVFAVALARSRLCSWLIGHIDPILNG